MTIKTNIHGLTIEIKAKGLHKQDRNNRDDVFSFLNTMSIYAHEAAEYNRAIGHPASADEADTFADILYYTLKDAGWYNRHSCAN